MEFISASAGSGKTYELTQTLSRALANAQGSDAPVRPEGVVAVTFTRKAASELKERVRRQLIRDGQFDAAQAVELGLLGTVHSVCGRLVREFAFELGISPDVEIIPEGEADAIFAQALTGVFDQDTAVRLKSVARRLDIDSLQRDVQKISVQARSNAMNDEALATSAQRSIEQMRELLDDPMSAKDTAQLDADFKIAVTTAITALRASGDTTKNTLGAINLLERTARHLEDDGAPWHMWGRLSTVLVGAKVRELIDEVRALAAQHLAHPRFHADLADYVRGVFDLSRDGIRRYQAYKKRRRLLDYVDLETLGLQLISDPEVERELEARLDLLLVDEFQDTNPIQLELFLRLARLAGRVVWVGDEKQAIYGFRGADPELVRSVVDQLAASEQRRTLEFSWRSRPDIVRLTSAIFARGLAADGIPEDRVALTPKRSDEGYTDFPAIEWWLLDCKNLEQDAQAVAGRLRDLLANPPQIVDRLTERSRALRPGDIAVLCRLNAHCRDMADVLEAAGIRAAIARPGLLSQLEARLALAALRVALDPGDSLAAAEVSRLSGTNDHEPDAWLQRRVQEVTQARQAEGGEAAWQAPFGHDAMVTACAGVAPALATLSPTEALDAVIGAVELTEQCLRWGNAAQRLANLEKLRALATAYEEHCRYEKSASTVAGFILYLDEVEDAEQDHQAEGVGPGAVQVLTYHRAKGLEWPVVVITGLDKASKPRVFEPVVQPADDFDATNPLLGRWVRLWPWPYGGISKGLVLGDRAKTHPAYARATKVSMSESRRLLYVGMTRARDQLVMATRCGKRGVGTKWLDELEAGAEEPIFTLPAPDADDGALVPITVGLDGEPVHAVIRRLSPVETSDEAERSPERWFDPGGPHDALANRPPVYLGGSKAELPEGVLVDVTTTPVQTLGDPISIKGDVEWMTLGSAVHRFLGADLIGRFNDRQAAAARLINSYELEKHTNAADWIVMADRLRAWIAATFADADIVTEMPLSGTVETAAGLRALIGDADLVLDTGDGWVLIDHKNYPFVSEEKLLVIARDCAPQLLVYATLIERATGKPVHQAMIHFPVAGRIVEVEMPRGAVGGLY